PTGGTGTDVGDEVFVAHAVVLSIRLGSSAGREPPGTGRHGPGGARPFRLPVAAVAFVLGLTLQVALDHANVLFALFPQHLSILGILPVEDAAELGSVSPVGLPLFVRDVCLTLPLATEHDVCPLWYGLAHQRAGSHPGPDA